MSTSWIIAKREFKSLFVSPIAYVVMGIFALACGFQFVMLLKHFDQLLGQASIQAQLARNSDAFAYINLNGIVVANLTNFSFFVLVLLMPLLTMNLLSEERSRGTYELLLTSPVTSWDIALGKFMASALFFLVILTTHAVALATMFIFGNPEPLPVLSAYLGVYCGGLVLIAIGLFASSLTRSQIIAAVVAFGSNIALLLISGSARSVGGNLGQFLDALSIFTHFENFNKGVIQVSSLVYLVTVVLFFLAATRISIQALTRS